MWLSMILFAAGLFLLIKGADIFVGAAVFFSKKLHIPQMVIGATIVSIGTTLPEVMVSAMGAVNHDVGIAYGNAIGFVICNTALIAGLLIAIRPKGAADNQFSKLFFFFFGAFALYCFFLVGKGEINRQSGIILLSVFLLYIGVNLFGNKDISVNQEKRKEEAPSGGVPFQALCMVMGPACVVFGSKLAVTHATAIAKQIGIPSQIIALTIL